MRSFVDFYLQDGISKVFVNGSNRGQCKVQSSVDAGGGASIFNQPPPGACAPPPDLARLLSAWSSPLPLPRLQASRRSSAPA